MWSLNVHRNKHCYSSSNDNLQQLTSHAVHGITITTFQEATNANHTTHPTILPITTPLRPPNGPPCSTRIWKWGRLPLPGGKVEPPAPPSGPNSAERWSYSSCWTCRWGWVRGGPPVGKEMVMVRPSELRGEESELDYYLTLEIRRAPAIVST